MFKTETIQQFRSQATPFYYYDLEILKRTLDALNKETKRYNFIVHYALKANANDKLLGISRDAGLGADCVSGNEVKKAVENNFSNNKIVFAGVGKSDEEITYALQKDIFCFNCESTQEMEYVLLKSISDLFITLAH